MAYRPVGFDPAWLRLSLHDDSALRLAPPVADRRPLASLCMTWARTWPGLGSLPRAWARRSHRMRLNHGDGAWHGLTHGASTARQALASQMAQDARGTADDECDGACAQRSQARPGAAMARPLGTVCGLHRPRSAAPRIRAQIMFSRGESSLFRGALISKGKRVPKQRNGVPRARRSRKTSGMDQDRGKGRDRRRRAAPEPALQGRRFRARNGGSDDAQSARPNQQSRLRSECFRSPHRRFFK